METDNSFLLGFIADPALDDLHILKAKAARLHDIVQNLEKEIAYRDAITASWPDLRNKYIEILKAYDDQRRNVTKEIQNYEKQKEENYDNDDSEA